MYGFQNIDVFSIEIVELAVQRLNFFLELPKTLDHKLYTVMREVRIFFGVDLDGIENEDGSNFFEIFDLPDECSVVK